MRGYVQPAHKTNPSTSQSAFAGLSRSRRMKLAKTAKTTLVKADQWARGAGSEAAVAEALDSAMKAYSSKKK